MIKIQNENSYDIVKEREDNNTIVIKSKFPPQRGEFLPYYYFYTVFHFITFGFISFTTMLSSMGLRYIFVF